MDKYLTTYRLLFPTDLSRLKKLYIKERVALIGPSTTNGHGIQSDPDRISHFATISVSLYKCNISSVNVFLMLTCKQALMTIGSIIKVPLPITLAGQAI
jgi:hypothetical protein